MEPEIPPRLPRNHPVNRQMLRGIAEQFEQSFKSWSTERNIRRDDFVDPYLVTPAWSGRGVSFAT
jgi:hypothetical protein